jgi:hypothetical protein
MSNEVECMECGKAEFILFGREIECIRCGGAMQIVESEPVPAPFIMQREVFSWGIKHTIISGV